MQISGIRMKLCNRRGGLRAVCSVLFDDQLVIHEIRIIEGARGLFLAMPSRPITDPCPHCSKKNVRLALYCNRCGKPLPTYRPPYGKRARAALYTDLAHPATAAFRDKLQTVLLEAYTRLTALPTVPSPRVAAEEAGAGHEGGEFGAGVRG